jgi:predicted MFS family arabinose efflux permease
VGRLPIGATALATIFLVQSTTGSFASAGAVDACFAFGGAIGLPTLGRMVDRTAQRPVLLSAALVNAAALSLLVVAARGGAATAVMGAIAGVAGASIPPLSACMRGLWSAAIDDETQLQSAFALEAVIIEVAFICGPLLAGGLTAVASPSAAVLASAVLTVTGTLGFVSTSASRTWRGAGGDRHWAGALRARGLWVIGGAAGCFGFGQGVLELTLTAFGGDHGDPALAGPLIAIQAAASLTGGLWYGSRRWTSPAVERYVVLNLLLAIGFAPLVLADSVAGLAVLMVPPGLALAPVSTVAYLLADRLAPRGTSTEAFGWLVTATIVGAGLGSAVGGAIVNSGDVTAGFVVAFGGVAFAAMTARAGRATLTRGIAVAGGTPSGDR